MLIIEEHLHTGVLIYIWTKYIWRQLLESRQRSVLKTYEIAPVEIQELIRDDDYRNYQVYALYKNVLNVFKETANLGLITIFIVFRSYKKLWMRSTEILIHLGFDETHDALRTTIFLTLLSSSHFLVNLPFSIYESYLSNDYEHNERVTMVEAVLSHIITQTIIFPFAYLLIVVFKMGGDNIFLYMFCVAELEAIFDLFDHRILEPLPPCELRNQLVAFTEENDFPLFDIFLVESSGNHHSKVFVHGVPGQKIIVLYNNIVSHHRNGRHSELSSRLLTVDEILALVAHEIAHWKQWHTFIRFLVHQTRLVVHLASLRFVMNYKPIYEAFGFEDKPYIIGIVLLQFYPIFDVCNFMARAINRQLEFSADRYVKRLKKDRALKSAIVKIGDHFSLFPVQDWFYSYCCYGQPSCHERILALDRYKSFKIYKN